MGRSAKVSQKRRPFPFSALRYFQLTPQHTRQFESVKKFFLLQDSKIQILQVFTRVQAGYDLRLYNDLQGRNGEDPTSSKQIRTDPNKIKRAADLFTNTSATFDQTREILSPDTSHEFKRCHDVAGNVADSERQVVRRYDQEAVSIEGSGQIVNGIVLKDSRTKESHQRRTSRKYTCTLFGDDIDFHQVIGQHVDRKVTHGRHRHVLGTGHVTFLNESSVFITRLYVEVGSYREFGCVFPPEINRVASLHLRPPS